MLAVLGFARAGLQAQLYVAGPETKDYTVRLGWSPSPSPGVTGYDIYWGYSSGQYSDLVDVGNVTDVTLGGLSTNMVYYFEVVAYDSTGLESLPSNEISYSVPVAAAQPPAITTGPMAQSVALGADVTFCVIATGTAPLGLSPAGAAPS